MWFCCLGQVDPWRRKWQLTPVFLPEKSHGQRSLVGCSLWDCKRIGHNLVTKQQQQQNCVLLIQQAKPKLYDSILIFHKLFLGISVFCVCAEYPPLLPSIYFEKTRHLVVSSECFVRGRKCCYGACFSSDDRDLPAVASGWGLTSVAM